MKPFKKFAEKLPWIYALLGIVVFWCIVTVPRKLLGVSSTQTPQEILMLGICEVIAAVLAFIIFGLFVGYGRLKYSGRGMKYGFRFLRVCLIVMVALFWGLTIASGILTGFTPVWQKIVAFVLLLTVGVVEEFTCRGIIFGGLLKPLGKSYGGIVLAGVISGLLFGFIHVFGNVVQGEVKDATAIGLSIGKTLSAGMFGFVLAIIYLKTRNIWVPVVLHSVYDGIIFFATYVLSSSMSEQNTNVGQYVVKGEAGSRGVIVYLVLIAVMVPYVIKSLKELKKEKLPVACPLDDEWYA